MEELFCKDNMIRKESYHLLDIIHCVIIGSFNTHKEASEFLERMSKNKFEYRIYRTTNNESNP